MRRYIFNGDIYKLKSFYFDTVIVGGGVAGLYTALNIEATSSCVVLSKGAETECNSYLAQGGVAAVIGEEDKVEFHYNDTLYAGAHLCDDLAVKSLVSQGPMEIRRLIGMGIQFDRHTDGTLERNLEGGHSRNRILHCGGDATGKELVNRLVDITRKRENIHLKYQSFLVDLVTYEGEVRGAIVYDGEYKLYISPNVILCTGGIGQLYQYTTNPLVATGDGIAAAIRAGAKVSNMEFVQFHPTALYSTRKEGKSFLISEAVRGEGGVLRNQKGERFMFKRHPMGELAPRDVVSREIAKEIKKGDIPFVYLDITSKTEEFLSRRFPTIYCECKKRGIDISKDYIPVCPVQHYFMGGIKVDLDGRTTIKGLYACGETASSGVHGANRLASNSLLECLVYGRKCAEDINRNKKELKEQLFLEKKELSSIDCDKEISICPKHMKEKIQEIMNTYGGIVRNKEGLEKGIKQVKGLLNEMEKLEFTKIEQMEAYNMMIVAGEILKAALEREESVGAHYREDDQEEVRMIANDYY